MTKPEPEPKATSPVRVVDSTTRNFRIALSLLITSFFVTILATLYFKADVEATAQREFDFICEEIQLHIANRLAASSQLLHGGAGLFDASETVTREEWLLFTEKLQFEQQLPGIQGIGFSLLIPPEQLDQHIEEIRSEGFPEYTVSPAGKRDVYSSIIYLEPFSDRNLRAFGYDMFSEPIRRAAMEQARDENKAVLSGKVILVQETSQDVQAGALMYLPVYRRGLPIDTVEQRRAAILGWVYSPYRMTDMLNGTLDDLDVRQKERQISLQIYDGDLISTDTLMYDNRGNADKTDASTAMISKTIPVDFAGHLWTLRFSQPGGLPSTAEYSSVWLVLSGGMIISLLLFWLTLSMLRTRVNAQRMADELTADLRESDERYRALFQQASDGIFFLSTDGKVLAVNQSFARMHGYSVEEMQNMRLEDLDTLEGTQLVPDRMQRLMAGEFVNFEVEHYHKDGHLFPLSVSAGLISVGGKTFVQAFHRDNGEQKQAEEAVRVSEERYRLLATNVPDIIYSLNGEGNIVTVNSSAFERYGYTEQDSKGKPFLNFILPEDRKIIMTSFIKALEEQRIFTHGLQFRIVAENGVRHWVELNSQARFDSQGGYAGEDGVLRNITERKQAEEKLAQLNHLNELILSSAAEGVLGLDTTGLHTFVNTAAAHMLGYSAEELIGRPGHKTWHHTKPDGSPNSEEDCAIHAAYHDGTVHRSSNDLFWRKDGTSFWVEYASTPLYENGCLTGAVLTFADITERKRAEQILQESAERIQENAAELTLAYDKTLEGWARALELRDQETEGHTRRVVQMMVDLANIMGIGEDEMENVRRGALLHDIGKMGIPDSVLLKPGTLNERELEIMRRHAEYAYELLKPIEYLRLSLDIPYCHHEKWDGSGYPRGLKGEEIPLVARIFALVDVWDALTSDRPYRKAWSIEQTLKYIKEQSGKHFDPRISTEFLKMIARIHPQSN